MSAHSFSSSLASSNELNSVTTVEMLIKSSARFFWRETTCVQAVRNLSGLKKPAIQTHCGSGNAWLGWMISAHFE